ncbi:unnamed protein product [Phytophthora fragariaefolia]|uniref:Unnamed protein product n=1 Tax=Phytophthora fragariaefolia TaxID=1490495 RepID=A0A9W6XQR9_9STRA|nr:unnamed protein product [Phytophthora fragariaefolia]
MTLRDLFKVDELRDQIEAPSLLWGRITAHFNKGDGVNPDYILRDSLNHELKPGQTVEAYVMWSEELHVDVQVASPIYSPATPASDDECELVLQRLPARLEGHVGGGGDNQRGPTPALPVGRQERKRSYSLNTRGPGLAPGRTEGGSRGGVPPPVGSRNGPCRDVREQHAMNNYDYGGSSRLWQEWGRSPQRGYYERARDAYMGRRSRSPPRRWSPPRGHLDHYGPAQQQGPPRWQREPSCEWSNSPWRSARRGGSPPRYNRGRAEGPRMVNMVNRNEGMRTPGTLVECILDYGSQANVCNDLLLCTSLSDQTTSQLSFANGTVQSVDICGSVLLRVCNQVTGELEVKLLENVMYIANAQVNIISLGYMQMEGRFKLVCSDDQRTA